MERMRSVHQKTLLNMKTKVEKEFDAVRLMRDLREIINTEIDKMSADQLIEYFRKAHEQYEKEVLHKT